MNEAAIIAAKRTERISGRQDIRKAFVKVGIGAEKKSRVISEKEKKITAYHEAGHAILFHVLPDVGPVYSVSIIPTGMGAAGYTMPLPEQDDMFNTQGKYASGYYSCTWRTYRRRRDLWMTLQPAHHRILNRRPQLPNLW